MTKQKPHKSRTLRTASYAFLTCLTIVAVFPLIYMASLALTDPGKIFSYPPSIIPLHPKLISIKNVLMMTPFPQYLKNTIYVSLMATLISTIISSMGAFSLSRGRYANKVVLSRIVLMAYMFPPVLMIIPLFKVIAALHLINTYYSLIISYSAMCFPFALWMLTAYFRTIPIDLDQAAKIDGASNFQVFWRIVLPLASPGLVATSIFNFIQAWNEFLFALVFANDDTVKTLSIGLYQCRTSDITQWGTIFAYSTLMMIPTLVFFFMIQRHMVSGLTAGSVKG